MAVPENKGLSSRSAAVAAIRQSTGIGPCPSMPNPGWVGAVVSRVQITTAPGNTSPDATPSVNGSAGNIAVEAAARVAGVNSPAAAPAAEAARNDRRVIGESDTERLLRVRLQRCRTYNVVQERDKGLLPARPDAGATGQGQPVLHGSGPGGSLVRAEPMPTASAPAVSQPVTSPGAMAPVGTQRSDGSAASIPARLA